MSTTEIAATRASVPAGKYASDEAFAGVSKSADYLCRLQLCTSQGKEVKSEKIPMNHYGYFVNKNSIIDLGKTVDIIPIEWRPKAMKFDGNKVISKFNPKDEGFQQIALQSGEKDSGCMFGPEYLVWIPSIKKFASFFMQSKSAKQEAGKLQEKMKQDRAATLNSQFVEKPPYSWQAPTVEDCNNPISDTPDSEALQAELKKFNNPPEDKTEMADEAQTQSQNRAR